MTIYTICRYNQARSIITAALLRKLFPDQEILSAGVTADPLISIPPSILKIATQWGLVIRESQSTRFDSLVHAIKPGDLLLAADEGVKAEVDSFNTHGKSLLLKDSAVDLDLDPRDPSGMSFHSTQVELAKASFLSVKAVENFLGRQASSVRAFIPANESAIEETARQALDWSRANSGFVVDSSFRAPHPLIWRSLSQHVAFLKPGELPVSKPGELIEVFTPRYEHDRPLDWTMSPDWFTSFSQGYANQSIALVTPPWWTFSGNNPDALLSALPTRAITIVSI